MSKRSVMLDLENELKEGCPMSVSCLHLHRLETSPDFGVDFHALFSGRIKWGDAAKDPRAAAAKFWRDFEKWSGVREME